MTQLIAKFVFSAALICGSAVAAQAGGLPGQRLAAAYGAPTAGATQSLGQRAVPAPRPVSPSIPGALGGVRNNGIPSPFIPQDTPMRQPIVPTAPGMPGQPPAIGGPSIQ
jgi:hypothetical protein